MKQIYSIFCIFLLSFSLSAKILLNVDFNKHEEGPYSKAMLDEDWLNPSWESGDGRVSITADPSFNEKSLQVLYPELGVGPEMSGAQWPVKFEPQEELFVSYYILFPAGWDGVKGGKLPGLCGSECPCSTEVTGKNGFSARYMFRPDMKIVVNCYHMDQPGKDGEDFELDYTFERGTWYKLTQRIKLNSPGSKNGELQAWVDDAEVLAVDTLRYRDVDTVRIDQFYFSTFYGGSTPDWAPLSDQYIYYDEFKVFTDANVMIQHTTNMKPVSSKRIAVTYRRNGDVHFTLNGVQETTFKVLNNKGQCLRELKSKDATGFTLSSQALPTGAYIMQVITPQYVLYKAFTMVH